MNATQHPEGDSATIGAQGLCCPTSGRLSAFTVERLHTLLGGDPRTEEMVLTFIRDTYGARDLMMLPEKVAAQVLRRPGDFLRAVKRHCEPQLSF